VSNPHTVLMQQVGISCFACKSKVDSDTSLPSCMYALHTALMADSVLLPIESESDFPDITVTELVS